MRNNVITMSTAHGIALGGAFAFRPRFEIYDNDITVAQPYSAFVFAGQNMANTVIRNNRTRGGLAGVAVLKPCCPPLNVEIRNNLLRDVVVPFVTAKNLSPGVRMTGNVFCMRGPVNAAQRQALPNNFMVNMAECEQQPPAPQQLRVH